MIFGYYLTFVPIFSLNIEIQVKLFCEFVCKTIFNFTGNWKNGFVPCVVLTCKNRSLIKKKTKES